MDWGEIERGASLFHTLTPREAEVVRLSASGLNGSEVGKRMGISRRTVETHRAKIVSKLTLKRWAHVVMVRQYQEMQERATAPESSSGAADIAREIAIYAYVIAERDIGLGGEPSERLRVIRDMVAAVARG